MNYWEDFMLAIAENLNTRNRVYMEAVKNRDRKTVGTLAEKPVGKRADLIN